MLNKIEFSDLYKFLTSVGLIIIASAFLIPWLFLTKNIETTITTDLYNNLLESSQTLITKKIEFNLFIVNSIPYISIILFFTGVIVFFIGIIKWFSKQIIVDKTEVLEFTLLNAKIKPLKRSEIEEKADKEIDNEQFIAKWNDPISVKEKIGAEVSTNKSEKVNTAKKLELRKKLLEIEDLFYQKIINYNTFLYETSSNVTIGDNLTVDILLLSNNHRKNSDLLFEIKYLQSKLNMNFIIDSYQTFLQTFSYYLRSTNRNCEMYIIFVYKENIAKSEEINRFLVTFNEYKNEISKIDSRRKLIIMNDKEAEDFKIESIIK